MGVEARPAYTHERERESERSDMVLTRMRARDGCDSYSLSNTDIKIAGGTSFMNEPHRKRTSRALEGRLVRCACMINVFVCLYKSSIDRANRLSNNNKSVSATTRNEWEMLMFQIQLNHDPRKGGLV